MPSAQVRERAAARRLQVVDLRGAGLSFEAIGRELGGISPQRAHALYRAGLAQLANGSARHVLPRDGRDGPPSRRVLLAALGGELAALGLHGGRPDRVLRAAARRVGRRLPPGDEAAVAAAVEALAGAAVLALGLPVGQARRLAGEGLADGGLHGLT